MSGRSEDPLRREAEGWGRLEGALGALEADRLERPGYTDEGWSIKDLLWHLAAWADDAARVLGEMRAGTWQGEDPSLEPGWTDRRNAEILERSREMPLDEVRSALPAARERLLAAFGALEEVTPDAEEWFEESGPTHYVGHLPDLERWVAELRSGA